MVVNGKWFDINGIGENEIPIVDNASFVADELDNVIKPGEIIAIAQIPAHADHFTKFKEVFNTSFRLKSSFIVI